MSESLQGYFENMLRLGDGWHVDSVEQDNEHKLLTIGVTFDESVNRCPEAGCGKPAKVYDKRRRKLRSLDNHDYQTYLLVEYPRVQCEEHGVQAVNPPFAEKSSRFTIVFEQMAYDRVDGYESKSKIAKELGVHWHALDGIIDRVSKRTAREYELRQAVRGGDKLTKVIDAGIDEVYITGRECATVISDKGGGRVLAVFSGRDAETVKNWFSTQTVADFSELRSISMDMAPPYIKAVKESFPHSDQIICYDRFHVAQLFSRALDEIRRKEAPEYEGRKDGNPFKHTRFEWLRNSGRTDNRASRRRWFLALVHGELRNTRTAKAWKLKELAARLWGFVREGAAEKAWNKLLWRLSHSRITELRKLYRTLKRHLQGILNAITLQASNAPAEALNNCIQRMKRAACGFRNKSRFYREIMLQFGGLRAAS